MLESISRTDFPLAIHLPVPDRYCGDYGGSMQPGMAHVSELDNPQTQLLDELYLAINEDLT